MTDYEFNQKLDFLIEKCENGSFTPKDFGELIINTYGVSYNSPKIKIIIPDIIELCVYILRNEAVNGESNEIHYFLEKIDITRWPSSYKHFETLKSNNSTVKKEDIIKLLEEMNSESMYLIDDNDSTHRVYTTFLHGDTYSQEEFSEKDNLQEIKRRLQIMRNI